MSIARPPIPHDGYGRRRHHPALVIGRGQLGVLLALVVLTIGTWALTVHQARTMDMPMGVAVRGGATDAPDAAEPAVSDAGPGMADMPMAEPAAAGMDGMAMPGMAPPPASTAAAAEPSTPEPGMAMAGMSAEGWSRDGFGTFLGAWAVMMAAMMLPAAAPMVLLFGTVYAKRRAQGTAFVPTWVFAAGYLLVWSAVGAAVYALVQLGSDVATRLGAADRDRWAPVALGATLVVAGVYQATPLKRVCLRHCQSPLGFVMQHWRDGRLGALRMGVRHGGYCLGCCWALFAVLVAAGVMSLAWMLLLTLVVFAEKMLPRGERIGLAVGAGLVALGALVAAGATGLPWTA